MTDFAIPELHEEIRQATARFAREVLTPAAPGIDEGGPIPAAVGGALAELGLWGLTAAEDRGGLGLDGLAYALVVEALAEGSPSVARRLATHAGPGLAGLSATDWDLDPYCAGEAFVSYVPAPGALAVAPADAWVTPEGVGREATTEAVDPMGQRGAGLAKVEVGTVSGPAHPAVRAWDDLGAAALALGSGRAALRAAIAYAHERAQFGKPLAKFQAIQWKIADAATALDAAELLVHRAAVSLDAVHAATARTVAVRSGLEAADHALQIHRGYGFTREYPVEKHLRSVRMMATGDRGRVQVAAARLG